MRMLGRQDALATIQMRLAEQKFVTIVGPGGIGKTTVAVAVAHEMGSNFNNQVHFVDHHSVCRYKQLTSYQP
jgi:predicted ATPase